MAKLQNVAGAAAKRAAKEASVRPHCREAKTKASSMTYGDRNGGRKSGRHCNGDVM